MEINQAKPSLKLLIIQIDAYKASYDEWEFDFSDTPIAIISKVNSKISSERESVQCIFYHLFTLMNESFKVTKIFQKSEKDYNC